MHSSDQKSLGRLTMLAIGAAGGVLLGKLAPVLFANVSGFVRGSAGQDPFRGLIREHRELLSLLTSMEETPKESSLKRMAPFLKFKRTIAKHALAEEDMFTRTWKPRQIERKPTEERYREHARMKVLLFELERALKEDESWIGRVRDLRNEIEPHAPRRGS